MKDLDFDELDRAVNSLIGGPAASSNTTATAPADPSGTEVSAEVTAEPTPTPAATPVASDLQSLAARRSSGRFMDVVHPSSDMRVPFVPPRPSVRETTPMQPIDTPGASAAAPASLSPEPSVAATPASTWPDPLDFHGFNSTAPAQEVTAPQLGDNDIQSQLDTTETDQQAPLESPFLADAKVEKRPLGAFNDATMPPAANQPDAFGEAVSVDTDRPMETDTPLPAELQDNLLSIESNEDTASVATEAPTITPTLPTDVVAPTPDVQVSIAQQYVEQPSTGDKPAGSIFDVDSYHKPIAHPKKHKSGWMVTLWIVLLLILGVGAGAAFYFYVLPTL